MLLALISIPYFVSGLPAADPEPQILGDIVSPSEIVGVVAGAVAIAEAAAAAASGKPTHTVICGTEYTTQTSHDATCTFQSVSEHFD
ncbi:hypothetical protein BDQ17DRAFT_1421302 [Cyathus striatus]|nr:hypothetical protein BDQ17DRAFT_1421302 [Cyathus striatus]